MYSFPSADAPIRQGDIFRYLPKIELVLGEENLPLVTDVEENGIRLKDWFQIAKGENESSTAYVLVKSVLGIVITQDCDASRCVDITFAEVKPFCEVYTNYKENSKPKAINSIITRHCRVNQKWYFLSENTTMGFDRKMGVDFQLIFEVKRDMLEQYKETIRLGRLDDEVAWPHFRERVAEYFRRYPYNEWYPMNSDELEEYEKALNIKVNPHYPWQ